MNTMRPSRTPGRPRRGSRSAIALDHPADILRLAGIKPGMRVADVLAGDGYYSELLSYVVGPKGKVLPDQQCRIRPLERAGR